MDEIQNQQTSLAERIGIPRVISFYNPSIERALRLLMIASGGACVAVIGFGADLLEASPLAADQAILAAQHLSLGFCTALIGLLLLPNQVTRPAERIRSMASICCVGSTIIIFGLGIVNLHFAAQCWSELIPLQLEIKEINDQKNLVYLLEGDVRELALKELQENTQRLEKDWKTFSTSNSCR